MEEVLTHDQSLMLDILPSFSRFDLLSQSDLATMLLTLLSLQNTTYTHEIVKLVKKETFNTLLTEGQFSGQSLAFFLCRTLEGRDLLARNNGLLVRQISTDALNYVAASGDYRGESVALHALLHEDHKSLVLQEGLDLVSRLTAGTLNHVVESGEYEGLSVGLLLSCTFTGRCLLLRSENILLDMLSSMILFSVSTVIIFDNIKSL